MHFNDLLDDRESDAVSEGGVGLIALVEFIEDLVLILARNGAAGVPYFHGIHTAVICDLDAQRAVFIGKFDGIVYQIDPDLLQKFFVASI